MQILKTDPQNPSSGDVEKIVDFLNNKKIVLLPTETVYTFAVDATDEDLIRKVYEIKDRDFSKPMHVVVSSLDAAEKFVEINEDAKKLAEKFLPGPLTLVLPKKKGALPDILTSGRPTLGIRIPDLEICLAVAKNFSKPFTTTSANISGGPNPYKVEEALKEKVDLIVDVGPLPNLLPSTIVDLTKEPWEILREGPIKESDIASVVEKG